MTRLTQDTEDVVARVARAIEDCVNLQSGAPVDYGLVAREALEASGRQSLSDRIDGLKGIVEAAYREGWVGGEESGRADIIDGIGWSADFGWERSEARAALHQEGIATDVRR